MGGCDSIPEEENLKSQNTDNNNQIITIKCPADTNSEEQSDFRILLLGSHGSGKSTIYQQLTILYCGGLELEDYEDFVPEYVGAEIKNLFQMIASDDQLVNTELHNYADTISQLDDSDPYFIIKHENAVLISQLWNDPITKAAIKERIYFDGDEYLLDNILRFTEPNYFLTEEDILNFHTRTVCFNCMKLNINNILTDIVDVGGPRSENSRLFKFINGFDIILYIVSLSYFDQSYCYPDQFQPDPDFAHLATSDIFKSKPLFLIFTKKDICEKRLKQEPEPLRSFYSDYHGDISNYDQFFEYIKSSYLNLLTGRKPEAWVEIAQINTLNRDDVYNLFQRIGRKVIETKSNISK